MAGHEYNWGEELGPDYFLNNLQVENIHILLHEMGHGFGLLGALPFFCFAFAVCASC